MTRRLTSAVVTLVAATAIAACGNNPNAPANALPLMEGTYTLSILATANSGGLSFIRVCPTASSEVSQNSRLTLKREGSRWRSSPLASADGAFEMLFDEGASTTSLGQVAATGTIRGTATESRAGFQATSVRFGDGTTAVTFSGNVTSGVGLAGGTIGGTTAFSGARVTPFTCSADTVNWTLRIDGT